MPQNTTKLPNLTESHLPMWRFDLLPKAVRQALQDAPYNVAVNPTRLFDMKPDGREIAEEIRRAFPALIRMGANDAYGPDHPQAKENP